MSLIWPLISSRLSPTDRPRFRRANQERGKENRIRAGRNEGEREGEHSTRLTRIQAHVAWTQSKGRRERGQFVGDLYCRGKIIKNRRPCRRRRPPDPPPPLRWQRSQIPAEFAGENTTSSLVNMLLRTSTDTPNLHYH